MILVFPVEKSATDCVELRYALRSMQYLEPEEVIIIGHKPAWLKNVYFIPGRQKPGIVNKQLNIFTKLYAAMLLTDQFLYCNDDHFLNPGFDPYVNYFSGTIGQMLQRTRHTSKYIQTIENTLDYAGGDIYNFDIHCPIYMNRKDFHENLRPEMFGKPWGVLIKSLYARTVADQKEYMDYKVTTSVFDPVILKQRLFFSCSDGALTNRFLNFLHELYPQKSKYEF